MIQVKVRTTPSTLARAISEMPRNLRGIATEAAANYLFTTRFGVKYYPPKPPKSKYIRTYKLRDGWKLDKNGAGIRIINSVLYAPYVQGDDMQAWMHIGRWFTVSATAGRNEAGMVQAAEKAASKYIKQKKL